LIDHFHDGGGVKTVTLEAFLAMPAEPFVRAAMMIPAIPPSPRRLVLIMAGLLLIMMPMTTIAAPRCPKPPGNSLKLKDSDDLNTVLKAWSGSNPCRGTLDLRYGTTYHLDEEYFFHGNYDITITGAIKCDSDLIPQIVKEENAVRHFTFSTGAHITIQDVELIGTPPNTFSHKALFLPSATCPHPFVTTPKDFGGAILLYSCVGPRPTKAEFTRVSFFLNSNYVGGAVVVGPYAKVRRRKLGGDSIGVRRWMSSMCLLAVRTGSPD